jgi:RHS repeat-associated protein
MGLLTKMNDESGQSSYAYNGFGRLLAKSQTVGTGASAKTFRVALTYGSTGTGFGHVTSMTYPSGNRVDIAYGSDGRPISMRFRSGDARQRYDYDGLDRLIGFDGASTSRFQYDANGNRTRATFGATTYLNAINATSNRLNSTTGPAPAKRNSFDAAGSVTSDGTIQYRYGADGRLSGVVVGRVSTAYRYNGLGQRVVKTGAGGVVHYVYDESGRLLGEYNGVGTAIQETVYLGDLPVAVLNPGTNGSRGTPAALGINYVYADHLSTPRVLTRASDNKTVWRWDNADPFGLDQPDENPGRLGVFTYNQRFPGQLFDRETNNHYNYFRDYDPQTGRYVQSDPIGLNGGINTYTYAGGNPMMGVDPDGLLCVCAYTAVLDANAKDKSQGQCAKAVRTALEAGGADTKNRPVSAKDYGSLLERNGFSEVPSANYTPMPGDTAVFNSYSGGSVHGHVQGYTGNGSSGWVSDFRQPRFWASRAYEGANSYTVYRPTDTGSSGAGGCSCK